jgi:DNA-binding CsgD family transcriptional regulator
MELAVLERSVDANLLALERVIAEVIDFDGVTRQVLGPLEELSGAAGSLLFTFADGPEPIVLGGSLATVMSGYTADLFREDALQTYSHTLPPSTFATAELSGFDFDSFRRGRPYNDFYHPNAIEFINVLWPTGLPYGCRGMFGLFLSRASFEPFPHSVGRALAHLEQPLRAMARRIAQFDRLRGERDAIRRLLDTRGGAFVLWDRDGRAAWRSPEADALLQQKGLLDELNRAANEARRQAHAGAAVSLEDALLGRPRRLRSGGAEVLVQFWSIAECDGPWLVGELDALTDLPLARGLSPAELRVLRCMSRGLSNKEISQELALAPETVKAQVASVLRQLGVNSRAKVAARVRDIDPTALRLSEKC